jgi:NAD(P)-dependent dehydrogenase (short-subunit alcohol dehydrogenase family)
VSFEIDLKGRRALVTGAGQHVGRAIAHALARAGAEVAVNDILAERADAVVREIEGAGFRAVAAIFDVTDRAEVQRCIQSLAPDILVNNVGNTGAGNPPGQVTLALSRFLDSDPSGWDPLFAVNLFGVMYCARAALPCMVERGWVRVVTIISDAARVAERRMAAYAAAKAGAAGFSRALAAEMGQSGVTVNCVSLGMIESEHVLQAREGPGYSEAHRKLLSAYLMPRFGRPDDPASLVVFLASDHAGWITGQTYPVNGGYSSAL